jgi:hypothetical protein
VTAEVRGMSEKVQTTVVIERDDAVENAVVALLNETLALKVTAAGTAQLECKMCRGRDENHAVDCPVPVLERWINPVEGAALVWS